MSSSWLWSWFRCDLASVIVERAQLQTEKLSDGYFWLVLSHNWNISAAIVYLSLPSSERSNQTTVDCPDGGCEEYEQNVWSMFPCCSSDGRTEGIEAAPTQSLQSQRKFRCTVASKVTVVLHLALAKQRQRSLLRMDPTRLSGEVVRFLTRLTETVLSENAMSA